ncbi:MAG: 2,3-bisphosphoglycerate-independent phosphoglycerate mutase [Desulfobacterales bacterium]|nr:2,3-bisphosphoglycerate-independent phosphoglycerate mutase [Desulfobacterales bacterium]
MTKPYMLMILDGWGIDTNNDGNAVYIAKTPYLDMLEKEYPHTRLLCSGEAVGLPEGIMGNSEVGHLNLGAGRIVYQELVRINIAIRKGDFFRNQVILDTIAKVKEKNSSLHLIGLLSDAGVHSHINHLFALLDLAKQNGISKVFVHPILDGRDTPPDSGVNYVKQLSDHLNLKGEGSIATICGRYFAMDRDNRWDRVEKAFRLYTKGEAIKETDPIEAVKNAYAKGETDEFIKPILMLNEKGKAIATIKNDDAIIFFNFRADRAREITRAFTENDFKSFNIEDRPRLSEFVTMTIYDEKFSLPIAFPPVHLHKILGEIISKNGLSQLRIAETEKYAHVTYFFNGGEEKSFSNEDRCLIPSPRDVPTYDFKPEMSAQKVADEMISRLKSDKYNFIVLNFANMDMVGHTGNLQAAIKAVETVDSCVQKVIEQVKKQGGVVFLTADHGNAEKMIDDNGGPHTAHTLNPVRFILIDDSNKNIKLRPNGILGDIAPTILKVIGIEQPEEMTGKSLIEE